MTTTSTERPQRKLRGNPIELMSTDPERTPYLRANRLADVTDVDIPGAASHSAISRRIASGEIVTVRFGSAQHVDVRAWQEAFRTGDFTAVLDNTATDAA